MSEILCFLRILGTRQRSPLLEWVGMAALALAQPVSAAQIDIPGPLGSVAFGTSVTVLPNGNFVVTDPNGPVSAIGAVYLYNASGTLISTLTGSSANDHVGSGGVIVVGGGNFVVSSPSWNKVGASQAGAVTWVNGSTGLTGLVSTGNSLTGTTTGDYVGIAGVTALSNGNYVVASGSWNNGMANSHVGAATWGNGSSGITGPVSVGNSLYGTIPNDTVGTSGVTALSNGNYVVASQYWSNGAPNYVGAVTWANGSSSSAGPVSASNSLVGTSTGDNVGSNGVTALSNGNYVVASAAWKGNLGAVTLASGGFRFKGTIQSWNSVLGTVTNVNGPYMTYAYDPVRLQLIVGRSASNIVTIFTMDQIFAGYFER